MHGWESFPTCTRSPCHICTQFPWKKITASIFLSFSTGKWVTLITFRRSLKSKAPKIWALHFNLHRHCAASCYCRNGKGNHLSSVFTTVEGRKRQVWTIQSSVLKTPCYNARRHCENDPFLPNNLGFDELLFCHQVRLAKTNPSWIVQYED